MRHALARTGFLLLASLAMASLPAAAQTPQPFPRPGERPTQPPSAPAQPAPAPATPASAADPRVPTEATLGVPVYPGAQFLGSYDAGSRQRFYLFGTNADYAQIVGYYRTVLKTRGDQVYTEPAMHMFDVARFRAQDMAFPVGVTVKDYTWGGSQGYLHVAAPGEPPQRFRTIIQIVPMPGVGPG